MDGKQLQTPVLDSILTLQGGFRKTPFLRFVIGIAEIRSNDLVEFLKAKE